MSKKMFKKQDVQNAIWQDTPENAPLVLEYAGQWMDDGKYQNQENILRETATGLFFCYWLSKSGSYFTDFTYSLETDSNEIELHTVVKTTKVIEVWE